MTNIYLDVYWLIYNHTKIEWWRRKKFSSCATSKPNYSCFFYCISLGIVKRVYFLEKKIIKLIKRFVILLTFLCTKNLIVYSSFLGRDRLINVNLIFSQFFLGNASKLWKEVWINYSATFLVLFYFRRIYQIICEHSLL